MLAFFRKCLSFLLLFVLFQRRDVSQVFINLPEERVDPFPTLQNVDNPAPNFHSFTPLTSTVDISISLTVEKQKRVSVA
jgi:hypothetical protein